MESHAVEEADKKRENLKDSKMKLSTALLVHVQTILKSYLKVLNRECSLLTLPLEHAQPATA